MLELYSLTERLTGGFRLAAREGWSSVHVCHFEGVLCVLPHGHSYYFHEVFCCFDLERIKAGFSSKDWLDILEPIIVFYAECPKCPPNQKLLLSMNVT